MVRDISSAIQIFIPYFSGGTLTTLLQCLDPNHLLQVFFQLLLEENVLFISSSSTYLTATAEAFCSLLYPFKWISPYIPLLPRLIGEELFADFELDCPVPFIIGELLLYSFLLCSDVYVLCTQCELDCTVPFIIGELLLYLFFTVFCTYCTPKLITKLYVLV